ncbi:MAG: ribbon-helix-helix domain-containing protein [Candidatus Woesearchaeota archaeon]
MPDKIISVRMPKSLINELKELADKNHYLDVSEEVRALLRQKYLEHQDPYSIKLMAIKESISKHAVPEKIKSLKEDLKKLLEELNALQ